MITNAMTIIHLLQSLVDVYLWLDDQIQDLELMNRIKARKAARIKYIIEEKQKIRLEILRELDSNNPKPINK